MTDSWSCMFVENGPGLIDDHVRRAMKMAACKLYLAKKELMLFEAEVCSGLIRSDWQHRRVFAVAGFLFRVEVEFEEYKDYKVNFLLNEADLRRGAELFEQGEEEDENDYIGINVPFRFPIDELYHFDDLSQRARMN